jgi:hypothetical protein
MAHATSSVLSAASTPSRRHHSHGGEHDPGDPGALELALLRRSLAGLADRSERCGACARTLLLGERVYEYASGAVRCELCRDGERQAPAQSHRVHGPEFGHSIRVIDRRQAR